MFKILDIKENDVANSVTGFTLAIFYSGCAYNCEGCFNPIQQDYANGEPYTIKELLRLIKKSRHTNISLIGEPTFKNNIPAFKELLRAIKDEPAAKNKNLYVWTGATYEAFKELHGEHIEDIAYLITDRFELSQRDLNLVLRGSRNQRIFRKGEEWKQPLGTQWN